MITNFNEVITRKINKLANIGELYYKYAKSKSLKAKNFYKKIDRFYLDFYFELLKKAGTEKLEDQSEAERHVDYRINLFYAKLERKKKNFEILYSLLNNN